jgi:hypothetical protein
LLQTQAAKAIFATKAPVALALQRWFLTFGAFKTWGGFLSRHLAVARLMLTVKVAL